VRPEVDVETHEGQGGRRTLINVPARGTDD